MGELGKDKTGFNRAKLNDNHCLVGPKDIEMSDNPILIYLYYQLNTHFLLYNKIGLLVISSSLSNFEGLLISCEKLYRAHKIV